MKTLRSVRIHSPKLTKRKYEKIVPTIGYFKDSVNFLIEKTVENPLFQKVSESNSNSH